MNKSISKAITLLGSQAELARKVGVGQPTISKWLNGSDIGARYIVRISVATKGQVSVDEILESLNRTLIPRKDSAPAARL